MTRANFMVAVALGAGLFQANVLASGADLPPSMADVMAYSIAAPDASAAKKDALRQNAIMAGIQGGMIQRAREITDELKLRSHDIDRAFEFSVLISRQGYLPPVVDLIDQKVETKDGAQRIEYAGTIYKVTRPARFVRVAPTWRDYLLTGLSDSRLKIEPLPEAIRPKTDEEKKLWADSVRSGWAQGIAQSDAIFKANLARMQRDYIGMLRYRYLLSRGMIKVPMIAETPDGIQVTKSEIAIDTGAKSIEVPAQMESDLEKWGGK